MKDFTYYHDNEISLINPACEWLTTMGLIETRWILDAKWLINHMNFNVWVGE